jgi:hypothetical protein
MAGPAPKTEKWTARENLHDYKEKADKLHLLVSGTVEVSDADKQPVLKQASGGEPKTLTLDLSIEQCSDPVVSSAVWKAANFDTIVEADRYESVDVCWDGKVIASTPVISDIEHGELLDKQSEAQNEVAAKVTGTGEASVKEVVTRVAEAIEELAGGVGKISEGLGKIFKKPPTKETKKAPPKKTAPPKKKPPTKPAPPKKPAPPEKKAPPPTKKAPPKKTAPAKKTVKKSTKTAKPAAKKPAKPARKTARKAPPKTKARRR